MLPGVSTLLYNISTPHSREGEYFFTYTVHMWPFYTLHILFCPKTTFKSMWTLQVKPFIKLTPKWLISSQVSLFVGLSALDCASVSGVESCNNIDVIEMWQ